MEKLLLVGAGGAIGAVLRYLISLIPFRGDWPAATLLTNVLGALVIGVVVGLTLGERGPSEGAVLFLKTGVCGGFTTFSTFSLETLTLLERGGCCRGWGTPGPAWCCAWQASGWAAGWPCGRWGREHGEGRTAVWQSAPRFYKKNRPYAASILFLPEQAV